MGITIAENVRLNAAEWRQKIRINVYEQHSHNEIQTLLVKCVQKISPYKLCMGNWIDAAYIGFGYGDLKHGICRLKIICGLGPPWTAEPKSQ